MAAPFQRDAQPAATAQTGGTAGIAGIAGIAGTGSCHSRQDIRLSSQSWLPTATSSAAMPTVSHIT